ncbi:MAG: hypothetical protein P1Q69_09100 [Candidatus Thorarchaeota archaeon]|nr:hypothetical protein [Candidatus Thorarchaeota archaeon]
MKQICSIIFIALFLLMPLMCIQGENPLYEDAEGSKKELFLVAEYELHEPILIESNAEFAAQALADG